MKNAFILSLFFLFLLSCQQEAPKEAKLSEKDFTPFEQINPQVYFGTPENIAQDPNSALTKLFQQTIGELRHTNFTFAFKGL